MSKRKIEELKKEKSMLAVKMLNMSMDTNSEEYKKLRHDVGMIRAEIEQLQGFVNKDTENELRSAKKNKGKKKKK
jgi:hypothetical protein